MALTDTAVAFASIVPEHVAVITTTPDMRRVRSDEGEFADWLRVEPHSLDMPQGNMLEITLQFTHVVGTIFVNFYGRDPYGAAFDQKAISTPATVIFQSVSASSHYLKIFVNDPGSQAEYEVAYALRSLVRTSHAASEIAPRLTLFSFSTPCFSSRVCLLLCLSIGICTVTIAILSFWLRLTKTRLRNVAPGHTNGVIPEDYHDLGDLASAQGKEHLARRCYSRAAIMEPENTGVHFELGKLLFYEKQYVDALKEFQTVLNGEPIPLEIYHYLAFSHLALNQIKQAEFYYEKSLECHGDEFAEIFTCEGKRNTRQPPRVLSMFS